MLSDILKSYFTVMVINMCWVTFNLPQGMIVHADSWIPIAE